MKVMDLFSGIGGFSLGLERAGMQTTLFCEIEHYPRKILKKHWPDVPIHRDVRTLNGYSYRGTIDVICGGFPCQDISVAGKQAGISEGTRSGLWSECARLLGEVRPRYAIFENVTALLSGDDGGWFQQVLWDISQVGYDAEWHCISASELGAHHHRDRVWIIAYPDSERSQRREECGIFGYGGARWQQLTAGRFCGFGEISTIEPTICGSANGIPDRSRRLKGLGNAVVPQIPELLGRAILAHDNNVSSKQ